MFKMNSLKHLEPKNRYSLILGQSPRYIVTTEQISAVLPRFLQKSPRFGKSYSIRNILLRFVQKSPSFGKSYSSRNILPIFVQKSPSSQIGPTLQQQKLDDSCLLKGWLTLRPRGFRQCRSPSWVQRSRRRWHLLCPKIT